MRGTLWLVAAALVVGTACGGSGKQGKKKGEEAEAAFDAKEIKRVVAIAKSIKASPAEAEKVLSDRGMTREELEDSLYAIAHDAEASAEYTKAVSAK